MEKWKTLNQQQHNKLYTWFATGKVHTLKTYKPSKKGKQYPAYKDTFDVTRSVEAATEEEARQKFEDMEANDYGDGKEDIYSKT